jgi:hypothetical protein
MVKKFLFASAIHRHQISNEKKSDGAIASLESKQSAFKLSSFMDQTQDFYTVNPQNVIREEAIRKSLIKNCQVVKTKDVTEIQLKQAVLDAILASERKQVPEFERLITSTKLTDKQTSTMIKQAQDAVFVCEGGMMNQAMQVVLE